MIFKELLSSLAVGLGLAITSSPLFISTSSSSNPTTTSTLGINTRSKPAKPIEAKEPPKVEVEEFDPDYEQDYQSKVPHQYLWHIVTSKNGKQYKLSDLSKDLDFSIDENKFTDDELSKIPTSKVKIYLFKESAWTNSREDDQYYSLSDEKVQTLFNGRDENKLKRFLLQLSIRVSWRELMSSFMNDKYYYPLIFTPKDPGYLTFGIKIKYFKKFGSLKQFIDSKLPKCNNTCNISSSDFKNFLDQDKTSFYK